MRYVKTLAHVTLKTFTSPAYYAELLKTPLWFSVKFYLVFWFIYSSVTAALIVPQVWSVTDQFVSHAPAELAQLYPPDLVIRIDNGYLSANVEEPYYYPFSRLEQALKRLSDQILGAQSQRVDYLFIIDTQANIDDFESLSAYALLTDRHVVYYNDQGNIEVVSLNNIDAFQLDRSQVDQFIYKLQPYLLFIPPFFTGLTLVGIFFFTAWSQLIYLTLFACLAWLISQIVGLRLTYLKSFQLSLHLFVAVTAVLGLASLAGLDPGFAFFRTLIMLLVTAGIFIHLKSISGQSDLTVITDK